ncbi:hypothetical protein JL722_386 [Aureococcus anophagefferens]|nr:hypothetical protein JL722_386 [Aureococcus anophagefferens]
MRRFLDGRLPEPRRRRPVVGDGVTTATLWCKSSGVLAGKPFFDATFAALGDCVVTWLVDEGAAIDCAGGKVRAATVVGPARSSSSGADALNALSPGVASAAKRAVDVARSVGWRGTVAGTRKTTPGFRIVEKYALLIGGAGTHRLDLSQMVMLKDNHVWAAGSITTAVTTAKRAAGFSAKIEVECRDLGEALEAAAAGADVVMLDNFDPADLKVAAKAVKAAHPHVLVEASGGITLDTMASYLSPDVDVVSQGALTQGYACVDFSLKLPKPEGLTCNAQFGPARRPRFSRPLHATPAIPIRRQRARRRQGDGFAPKQVNPLKWQFAGFARTWGDWLGAFDDAARPLVVDVGCGEGEWVAAAARRFPHLNFLGVDVARRRSLAPRPRPNAAYLPANSAFGDLLALFAACRSRGVAVRHRRRAVAGRGRVVVRSDVDAVVAGALDAAREAPALLEAADADPEVASLWPSARRLA